MAVEIVVSLLRDPATYRPDRLVHSWRTIWRSPFLRREVWQQLRDYNRPDFHPDDRDTTELVELWRKELFGDDGSLNERLATTAA